MSQEYQGKVKYQACAEADYHGDYEEELYSQFEF